MRNKKISPQRDSRLKSKKKKKMRVADEYEKLTKYFRVQFSLLTSC